MQPAAMRHATPGSLVVDLDAGEGLVVTVPATEHEAARTFSVTLHSKSGRRARLRIATGADVHIDRKEVETSPC